VAYFCNLLKKLAKVKNLKFAQSGHPASEIHTLYELTIGFYFALKTVEKTRSIFTTNFELGCVNFGSAF
jgi:hypothetical protein